MSDADHLRDDPTLPGGREFDGTGNDAGPPVCPDCEGTGIDLATFVPGNGMQGGSATPDECEPCPRGCPIPATTRRSIHP